MRGVAWLFVGLFVGWLFSCLTLARDWDRLSSTATAAPAQVLEARRMFRAVAAAPAPPRCP
jgi:hypothetical protein